VQILGIILQRHLHENSVSYNQSVVNPNAQISFINLEKQRKRKFFYQEGEEDEKGH
jgi:hypothetical protein